MNKRLVAFVLAVAMVVSLLTVGIIHARSAESRSSGTGTVKKENANLVTDKQVVPGPDANNDGRPDSYDITLTSYLEHPSTISDADKTDTVLVLERSLEMNNELYTRNKTNLYTYTDFTDTKRLISNNAQFDPNNVNNIFLTYGDVFGAAAYLVNAYDTEIIFTINNTYLGNKYVKDPNNPNVYVYLSQNYQTRQENNWFYNYYDYSIVDSQGNVYVANGGRENLLNSGIRALLGGWSSSLSELNFTFQENIITGATTPAEGVAPTYHVENIVQRTGDYADNATNAYLWNKQQTNGPLWIKDNDGNWLKVKIFQEGTYQVQTKAGIKTYTPYYVYKAYDPDTPDSELDTATPLYISVYGNPYYGAEESLFQGFKVYNADGSVDYDNSLLHKSLYCSEAEEVSVTRLEALKESVEDFILRTYQNSYLSELPDGYQRIGIVSYSDAGDTQIDYQLTDVKSEAQAYRMIQTVYNYEADGRRRIDTGLQYAKTALDNGHSTGRKINVVSFTAGNPSYRERNNDFEMIIADNALSRKQIIENAYPSAKFYSIGLYEGSNSDELYGDSFRRLLGGAIPCEGEEGQYWGGTIFSSWTNPDMSPADAAATNRFLNYLSSNYTGSFGTGVYDPYNINPFSSEFRGYYYGVWPYWGILPDSIEGFNLGITGQDYIIPNIFDYGLSTGGYGYNIIEKTPDGAWSNDGYYYAATDGADLDDAFVAISDAIELPLSDLDEDTELQDYITEYFTLVDGSIEAYAADRNGNPDASIQITAAPTDEGDGVIASGLNYSDYSYENGSNGRQMVVKFTVEPIGGFLGGNQVPTNEGTSGVYDKNQTLVENFDVPKVDILPKADITTEDLYIYLTQVPDLRELFEVSGNTLNGTKNDFVDVTYIVKKGNETVFTYSVDAGTVWNDDTDGEYSINGEEKVRRYPSDLNDTTAYTIECVVTPIYSGTKDAQTAGENENAHVYVYKPVISLQDTEKTYSEAQQVNLNENITSLTWSAEGTNEPAPSDGEPTISYEFFEEPYEADDDVTNPVRLTETTNFRVVATVTGDPYPYETDLEYYVKTDGTTVLKSAYPIDDTQVYPELKRVTMTVYDSDGRESEEYVTYTTTNEQGQEVTHYVYETTIISTPQTIPARSTTEGVSYYNYGLNGEEGDQAAKTENHTKGNFTVYVGRTYKLYIAKEFKGDFVVPEDVKFTITGSDNSSQELIIPASQINRLKSGDKLVGAGEGADFATGITYTVVEDFENPDTLDSKYDTTATIKIGASGTVNDLADNDPVGEEDDKAEFDFTVSGNQDPGAVYITIKNTDNSTPPPATGKTNAESKVNPFFIAAIAVATLGSGCVTYFVRRKNQTTE